MCYCFFMIIWIKRLLVKQLKFHWIDKWHRKSLGLLWLPSCWTRKFFKVSVSMWHISSNNTPKTTWVCFNEKLKKRHWKGRLCIHFLFLTVTTTTTDTFALKSAENIVTCQANICKNIVLLNSEWTKWIPFVDTFNSLSVHLWPRIWSGCWEWTDWK